MPVVDLKDLFRDNPIVSHEELSRIDLRDAPGIEKFFLNDGDILFVRASVKRLGVGVARMVGPVYEDTVYSENITRFRLTARDVDPLFLTYLLRAPQTREKIIGRSGGSAVTNISHDRLASIRVHLPPFELQLGVSAILSTFDQLIRSNLCRIQVLEEIVNAIYQEWFVHFRFPEHEMVEMVGSDLGEIPEGWEISRLGQIVYETRRIVDPADMPPETPYVGLADIPRKSLALSEWGRAKDAGSSKLEFREGEILFGKIRPYFHKVVVAPFDGICSGDTIVIASNSPEKFALALSVVNSDSFIAHAAASSKGTKMPRADWEILAKYPVIIPDPHTLKRFSSIVGNSLSLIHTLVFLNRNLQRVRDLLLPLLVSGKIDVTHLRMKNTSAGTYQTSKYEEQSTLNQWLDDGAEEDVEWD